MKKLMQDYLDGNLDLFGNDHPLPSETTAQPAATDHPPPPPSSSETHAPPSFETTAHPPPPLPPPLHQKQRNARSVALAPLCLLGRLLLHQKQRNGRLVSAYVHCMSVSLRISGQALVYTLMLMEPIMYTCIYIYMYIHVHVAAQTYLYMCLPVFFVFF